MKSFKKYILEDIEKRHHVGTCVNSFDNEGDNCNFHVPYRDASHFADSIQDWKSGGNKPEHQITKNEFDKHVNVPKELSKIHKAKDTEFLHDKDNDIHIMYDSKKDIHHFFK